MRLVLASGNAGKVAELRDLLVDSGIDVTAQSAFGLPDIEESASTFVENALLKARHAARATGLPALADDSGLCVEALGGAPGLYSARYGGTHGDAAANIARLLAEMAGVPEGRRDARFYCVVVLLRSADDPQPLRKLDAATSVTKAPVVVPVRMLFVPLICSGTRWVPS